MYTLNKKVNILLRELCEGFPKSEHTANIDGEHTAEIIAAGREIIIHSKLWLDKEFAYSILSPDVHTK